MNENEEFLGPTLEEVTAAEAVPPVTKQGNYTILKSMVEGTTGVKQEEVFEFENMVDRSYDVIARVNNATDMLIAQEHIASGNTVQSIAAFENIKNRLGELESEQANRQVRLREIAQSYIDSLSTSDEKVTSNNSPARLAANESAVEVASFSAKLEKFYMDMQKEVSGVGNITWGIAQEFIPTAAFSGFALDSFARKFLPEDSIRSTDLQSRTVEALQAYYKSLPDDQKLSFAQEMYTTLKEHYTTSGWLAAIRTMEVMSGEAPGIVDEVGDVLQKLGVPAVLFNVVGVLKGLGLMNKGAQAIAIEREIAKNGGKELLNKSVGARMMAKGAATAVGQATGVSDIVDAAKLVVGTSAKLLPDAITNASAPLQAILRAEVEKLKENIASTVRAGNIRPEEGLSQLEELRQRYDPSTNKSVHTFTIDEAGNGKIVLQAPDGKSFAKMEDAQAFIKSIDPSNTMGFKVVPDTTNTNFLVSADEFSAKVREKNVLEANLLKLLNDLEKKSSKPKRERTPKEVTKKTPEEVKFASDNLEQETNELFKQGGVRPPGQAQEGDVILFKAEGMTEWSTDENAVRSFARNSETPVRVRAIAVPADRAPSLTSKSVQGSRFDAEPTDEELRAMQEKDPFAQKPFGEDFDEFELTKDDFELAYGQELGGMNMQKFYESLQRDSTGFTRIDNTLMSASITAVSAYRSLIGNMGPKLGVQNVPLVVVQWQDLLKSKNPFMQYMGEVFGRTSPTASAYYTKMPAMDGKEGFSLIVMKKPISDKTNPTFAQLEVFAHEYGHFFEDVFMTRYGHTITKAFYDWRKARGLKGRGMTAGDKAAFRSYYPSHWELHKLMKATETQDFKAFTDITKDEWFTDASEFFAENFAKWMWTDAIPRTTFDKAMHTIVESIKSLARAVAQLSNRLFGEDFSDVNPTIRQFMNTHLEKIKNGDIVAPSKGIVLSRIQTRISRPDIKDSRVSRAEQIEDLRTRIKALDDELLAMKSAKEGLVHGWLVERSLSPLNYASLAGYRSSDISSLIRTSLGDWALGTSSELYANRVVGLAQSSRYQKLLTEFVRPDLEKLNRGEKQLLSDILVKGDKEQHVFDSAELAAFGANKKVEMAYYKVRTLRDQLYQMRNAAAVDSLTRKGYVSLTHGALKTEDNPFVFGKEVSTTDIAGKRVYDADGKVAQVVTPSVIESLARSGRKVYELKDITKLGGANHKYVIVDPTTKVQPITQAIPYRNGEYKRIYSDEYFVKLEGMADVDGTPTEVKWAHRTAPTRREAEAYAKDINELITLSKRGDLTKDKVASMQKWGWDTDELMDILQSGEWDNMRLVVNYTRTEDDYIEEGIATTRGFSQRRGNRIPSVYGEDTVNTVNPIDSISAEITNTAFMVPITEWRDVAVYRWYNTAKEYNALPPSVLAMKPEQAFYHMVNNKGDYIGSDQEKLALQRIQDYVIHELQMHTKDESHYLGAMRRMSEMLEGNAPNNKAIQATGAWLRQADPVSFGRTIAFHSMLGGLNPVQLLVQGMNAVNAVLISPKHGIVAAKTAPMMRIALMSDNEEVWRKAAQVEKLSTLGFTDVDEFVESVRAIRRSGILDGINTTSLYAVEEGKWSLFNKWTRRASETSAFFFNRGEEMARITSFDIARREYIEANPGVAWWTDASLNKIMERQDDLTQNMTRANTAKWQQGVLSIPMQFMQYNIKIALNVIASFTGNTRVFSRGEAARLMVGHSLMFGVLGMGLGSLVREVIGDATEELTPEQMLYVQQGVIAGVINSASLAMSGEQTAIAFGSRFNTFETYENIADAIFRSSDDPDAPTVRDVLTGAVGASIKRAWGNYGDAISLFYHNDDITLETVSEALVLIGTGTFSSLNNLHKSYLAANAMNYVQSKSGSNMYKVTDSERMLLAVGIPPAAAADFELLMNDKKARESMYKDVSKNIARHQTLALAAYNSGDMKTYQDHKKVVQAMYAGLNVHDRIKVDQMLAKDWVGSRQRQLLIERLLKDAETTPPLINRSAGDVR